MQKYKQSSETLKPYWDKIREYCNWGVYESFEDNAEGFKELYFVALSIIPGNDLEDLELEELLYTLAGAVAYCPEESGLWERVSSVRERKFYKLLKKHNLKY